MIVTLAEVKKYLKITNSDSDDFLETLIEESQNWIENFLRCELEYSERTVTFEGFNGTQYHINDIEVASIVSLKYKDSLADDFTTIDNDYYNLNKLGSLKYLFLEFGYSASYYELVYNAGYSDVPAIIKEVAKERIMVSRRNSGQGSSTLGLSQNAESQSGVTNTVIFSNLENAWKTRLKPYRQPLV